MVNKKLLLTFIIILISSAFLNAQKKFNQKIQWSEDPNAFEYKVELKDKDGKVEVFETDENFLTISKPSGNYLYRIFVYDFLGRESNVSDWKVLKITKAVQPKIEKIQPKVEIPVIIEETGKAKVAKSVEIPVAVDSVTKESKVELVNTKTKERIEVKISKVESGKATSVVAENIPEGQYKIKVTNPGGLSSESESVVKVEKQDEKVVRENLRKEAERIAREKAEAEEKARLEAERIAREKAEAEEQARLEAERIAREKAEAEEKARLEAERIAREKAEAEEKARLEAERIAREKAEAEEQARLEAERIAAEEKARAEELARIEEERKALEEAELKERIRVAEEARQAAEKARQEEQARLEAERQEAMAKAGEEAARIAAEALALAKAAELAAAETAAQEAALQAASLSVTAADSQPVSQQSPENYEPENEIDDFVVADNRSEEEIIQELADNSFDDSITESDNEENSGKAKKTKVKSYCVWNFQKRPESMKMRNSNGIGKAADFSGVIEPDKGSGGAMKLELNKWMWDQANQRIVAKKSLGLCPETYLESSFESRAIRLYIPVRSTLYIYCTGFTDNSEAKNWVAVANNKRVVLGSVDGLMSNRFNSIKLQDLPQGMYSICVSNAEIGKVSLSFEVEKTDKGWEMVKKTTEEEQAALDELVEKRIESIDAKLRKENAKKLKKKQQVEKYKAESKNLDKKTVFTLIAGAGYSSDLFKGDLTEKYNDDSFPPTVNARIGVGRSPAFLNKAPVGFEIAFMGSKLGSKNSITDIKLPYLNSSFNFTFQKDVNRDRSYIGFNGGTGILFIDKIVKSGSDNNKKVYAYQSVDCGVLFGWKISNVFAVQAGIDYVRTLGLNQSFLNPYVAGGIRW